PLPLVNGTRLWTPTVSIVGHTTSDGRHVKTMRDATASQYCNDAREAHAVPLVRGSDARREQQTASVQPVERVAMGTPWRLRYGDVVRDREHVASRRVGRCGSRRRVFDGDAVGGL